MDLKKQSRKNTSEIQFVGSDHYFMYKKNIFVYF